MIFNSNIRLLEKGDIPLLVAAFATIGWNKTTLLFQQYLEEQKNNQRCVWVAFKGNAIAGYVTLKWHSEYTHFREEGIPEISDLNVLPRYRRQGIGSQLLDIAEHTAYTRSTKVGLGVGLYADYGPAQKLYIRRCYVPDGNGVTHNYQQPKPGSMVRVDDDLVLWLIKQYTNN